MTFDDLMLGGLMLRADQGMEKIAVAGKVMRGLAEGAESLDDAGKAMSDALKRRGHGKSALVARVAPHAAALLGGHAVYKGAKRKVQEYKYRRAVARAQRGR